MTMVYAVLRFSNFGHGEIMSFGTMLVILTTFAMQDVGLSISPLPTALVALPAGIVAPLAYVYYLIDMSINFIDNNVRVRLFA